MPNAAVHIVDAEWLGPDVVDVTYKDAAGARAGALLFRSREGELEVVEEGRPWSFDSDANAFKLAAEAKRISLGYLFDPCSWPVLRELAEATSTSAVRGR